MAQLLDTNFNDTGYLRLPVGTDADRPANEVGAVRLNSNLGIVEYSNGSNKDSICKLFNKSIDKGYKMGLSIIKKYLFLMMNI